jgi:hypothetical protein
MRDNRTQRRTARPWERWGSRTLIVPTIFATIFATLTLACHPADMPGVPLYPNGETTRLPRFRLAQVAGPISKIDSNEVQGQGGLFDLLPGCHIVELERRLGGENFALSSGSYWSGQFPVTIYAIRMKPGAYYDIRRELESDGQSGRIRLSAREQTARGAVTDLFPVKSAQEIQACQQ